MSAESQARMQVCFLATVVCHHWPPDRRARSLVAFSVSARIDCQQGQLSGALPPLVFIPRVGRLLKNGDTERQT